jgi:hypothetical protein
MPAKRREPQSAEPQSVAKVFFIVLPFGILGEERTRVFRRESILNGLGARKGAGKGTGTANAVPVLSESVVVPGETGGMPVGEA